MYGIRSQGRTEDPPAVALCMIVRIRTAVTGRRAGHVDDEVYAASRVGIACASGRTDERASSEAPFHGPFDPTMA